VLSYFHPVHSCCKAITEELWDVYMNMNKGKGLPITGHEGRSRGIALLFL
jgi:hypothetical protein